MRCSCHCISLQEKLPWPTKLKSRRGCWCTMADDFWSLRGACQIFFFSFLRPPSPTKAAKTSRMVARDVVHLEFSGSPADSTQIRTTEGCRAQMAASLALFFPRSRHLVQRSPIEPFTMQDHGSRMSSSMNQNSFYSWIFLTP